MRSRRSAELALIVTVVIWSLNFTSVKVGIAHIEPLAFSVVRFALGAAVTAAVVLWREGMPHFRRRDMPLLLTAAACGITINQAAFVGALSLTSASNVALLVGTIPIFTALIAVASHQEKLNLAHWIALVSGLVGVTLIVLGSPGEGAGAVSLGGGALALLTAASWAAYSVIIRPLMRRYSALQLSAFMMIVGTVALVPFALPDMVRQDWSSVPSEAWLALGYAAILSVALTNILYFNAIGLVGASRAAMYAYLEPFLGVLFAVVLIKERVELVQLIGGLIIVAAVALGRPRQSQIAEPGI
jgi:drug/metabolite transporter (DMT)-like permease